MWVSQHGLARPQVKIVAGGRQDAQRLPLPVQRIRRKDGGKLAMLDFDGHNEGSRLA